MARVTIESVIDRLHYVQELVQQADTPSLALLASFELGPIAQALLVVLDEHRLDERGRCKRRSAWWRLWHRRQPCRDWALAHHHLIDAPPTRPTGPVLAVGGPR